MECSKNCRPREDMCPIPSKKAKTDDGKKREGETSALSTASRALADYSHIFNESDTELYVHRAMMMQRLVQDPFYKTMNVSVAARMWMLRHLACLAEHAKHTYHLNLMQFFDFMGHESILKFMKFKNAPQEMYVVWNRLYPATPGSDASKQLFLHGVNSEDEPME